MNSVSKESYFPENDLDKEARFDIVSVIYFETSFEVEHTERAFYVLN